MIGFPFGKLPDSSNFYRFLDGHNNSEIQELLYKSNKLLLEKGLIEEAGRLDLPGRPVSFRTTDTFLRVFGLSSLADLPPVHSDVPADDPTESEG